MLEVLRQGKLEHGGPVDRPTTNQRARAREAQGSSQSQTSGDVERRVKFSRSAVEREESGDDSMNTEID